VLHRDDAPEAIYPCSFRLTANMEVRNEDGDVLATSMNEMMRDNGDYWVWKSQFSGDEFIKSIVPDHEWSIIWRPDTGYAYRHDIVAQKCYKSTFEKQPTPYNWIQSKTYGIMWFDELIEYEGQEATLYSSFGVGSYGSMDYEIESNFYVINKNQQLVHINGTVSAAKQGIKLFFESKSLSFEHNTEVPLKSFAVSAPCDLVASPAEPSAEFQLKCYGKNAASFLSVSWLALVVAILACLLNF